MSSYLDYNIPIINNSDLPNYPIPDMIDTLERFLEWVQPLITQKEYQETSNLVESFIKSDDSKKLNEHLNELGNQSNDSWIFDYWLKTYLRSQEPLVPFTNVPIVYENKIIKDFTVIEKASALIYGVANTYSKFRENGSGSYHLGKKRYSSDQFHGILGSINHIQRDMSQYYINSDFSTNIIVIYRNHIYSLEVISCDQKVVDVNSIYNAIKDIYNGSISPISPNINFVTAEPNRSLGGDFLAEILEDSSNNTNYQKIKDSIFVLNLDDDNPKTSIDELYSTCLDTNNFNRWHGKGLQFSISKNGVISFIIDHSFCDASTTVYLIDQMNLFMKNVVFNKSINTLSYYELHFNIDEKLSLKLIKSFENYRIAIDSFTASYVELEGLSRSDLRANNILSGDGFFHLALQAAQKMTFDNIYNTYIAVDMRMFFKGRTEANRPVSHESIGFVHELLNPTKNTLDQKKLLQKALDVHYNRTVSCTSGKGVNRYLYILKEIYDDCKDDLDIKEKPALFDSPGYKAINYNKLSTTSFCHEDLKYSYFPPVVKGGLGIYYIIGDKSFAITTAFNEDKDSLYEFNKNLKYCINQMLKITSHK